MKNSILKITALFFVFIILSVSLASCGTLSGKYEANILGTGAAFTFKGSKVTLDVMVLGSVSATVEGKYKVEDGKITLTFDSEDEDVEKYSGTFDFEQGEDYIKIGLVKYSKAD